ncbi:MAG: hypothetical protein K2L12_05480 [Clostridia bacterium]|nr:hypothetical protein [Clostridia bacterium]
MTLNNEVSYCYITFPHIGDVDFKKDLILPIVFEPVLDETLNTATITLSDLRPKDYPTVDVSLAFEPFTLVRIGFAGQDTEIRMLIAHDDCKLKRKDEGNYKSWKHTIQLVEETKQLERESVDTLTFTNPLDHDFTDGSWDIDGTVKLDIGTKYANRVSTNITHKLQAVNYAGDCYIPSFGEINGYYYDSEGSIVGGGSFFIYRVMPRLFLYKRADYLTRSATVNASSLEMSGTAIKTVNSNSGMAVDLAQGEYIAEYVFVIQNLTGTATNDGTPLPNATSTSYVGIFCKIYEFALVDKNNVPSKYTIKSVIDRLLNLTPNRLLNENNKYAFNESQLAEFDKEESPEFAFTGYTLFEALFLVASYEGSFPKLNDKTISFRTLWNGEHLSESDLPKPIDESSSSDINQYCTYIETDVQNLVGLNDSQIGTIIEPYAGGYKTTRSENSSEISEDTAIISTSYNIYQSIKLEMGLTNGVEIGDIAPYVYEQGEYNGLSDTSGLYPNSKAYALKWEQMGRNYTELAHRINNNALTNALVNPAIANIVFAKTGESTDSALIKYLKNLVGIKGSDSMSELMFRTSYVPVLNARIKQYKDYFGNFHHDGSIKYNQTAELVDSEMYGEHLKQLIRKIGNATKIRTYIFDKIDHVPEVGTVVDGYSIYDVKMSVRENEVVATIFYVKYAELSQYIGVKNAWKDSDISINKCYNRAISYNEFLLFTRDGSKTSTTKALTAYALNSLMVFTAANPLTCVEATGYYTDGKPINTLLLSVVSLALGNSIFFQWAYEDNYSAGSMSQPAPEGATSVLSGTKYNRAKKAVSYCDMFGRMETYDFSIMPTGPVPNGSNIGWKEDSVIYSKEYVMRKIGYSLPLKPDELVGWNGKPYISVEKLLVEKNSSEALTFSVQLHYCTDNENFIIGSGLTNFCSLVGGEAQEVGLYGFTNRINIFKRRFSVNNATKLSDIGFKVNSEKLRMEIELPKAINNYSAWALMGKDKNGNYQIIFGENKDLNGSDFETELYLLPMHKLEDFI